MTAIRRQDLAGVILAGGRSSRMGGGDKFLLDLHGRTILDHVVARMAPQVGTLALNLNGDPQRLAGIDLPVLPDTLPGHQGPLAGVLTALGWARSLGIGHVATAAADTPFLPVDLVRRLQHAVADGPQAIAIAMSGGRTHPVFCLWPTALHDDLARFLSSPGNRRVSAFVGAHPHAAVDFTVAGGPDPFFNVNTPQDLEEAERLARSTP